MNQHKAIAETVKLIEQRLGDWTLDYTLLTRLPSSMQLDHLLDMAKMVAADENSQGGTFSEGKLGRWLGWIQAAGTALGVLDLEECKAINIRNKD